MIHVRRPALLSTMALVALAVAACGGDDDPGGAPSAEVASTVVVTTDTATTSDAPDTTEPPSTTTATTTEATSPTTSAAPSTTMPAGPPTLRSDGIGPYVFGGPTPEELLGELTDLIGAPTLVTSAEYPVDAGGFYEDPEDDYGFAYPAGRTACFANGLCVEFGGPDESSLRFVGYRQSEGPGSFATASGVTAGSPGSAFASALVIAPGGCFSTGSGTADGVPLVLESNGEPFGRYDEVTDTYVNQAPPASDVVVIDVLAGDQPAFLLGDC